MSHHLHLAVLAVSLMAAWSSHAQESAEQLPEPANRPEIIYGLSDSAPLFVPAESLRGDVNVTPEGWIILNHSVRNLSEASRTSSPSASVFKHVQKLRRFDSQIRLAKAQIDSLKRRLSVYHYINQAGALMVTVEHTQLSLIEANERLRELRMERLHYQREFLTDQRYGGLVRDSDLPRANEKARAL